MATKSLPLVSIVIVTYNNKQFIKRCLKSLLATNYPNFEIIVVDNGSKDGTSECVEQMAKSNSHIRIIKNSKNVGHAEGCNIGVKNSKGEIVAFIDSDTSFEPDWLDKVVKVLNTHPSVGVIQSILISMRDKTKIDGSGGVIDYCGIEQPRPLVWKGKENVKCIADIFYAKSAAMIARKKLIHDVGFFDPTFFVYGDDADICWRIRLRGYDIALVLDSVVYHAGGGTMGQKLSPFSAFHWRKNHITTFLKNYEVKNVLKYLTLYLVFLTAHGIYKILQGEYRIAIAYIKAILWNLKNLKHIYSKRLAVQRFLRKVSDNEIKRHMVRPRIPWHLI